MALQIRRGLEADRAAVTPAIGELLYTTDEKLVYVGDGTTAGGNLLAGGGSGNVVDDTSPQLGGNLDVNGFSIISATDTNIDINPGGNGDIVLHGNLTIDPNGNFTKTGQLNISPTSFTSFGSNSNLIDGNLFITRNTYSAAATSGFTFAQHHETADAVNFTFYRSRGTGLVPTAVVNGDRLADIAFAGDDGSAGVGSVVPGAQISAVVDGTPVTGNIPTRLSFITNNGTTTAGRAEITAAGVFKSNSIQNFSGTNLNITGTGTVSATNSIISNGAASPSAGTILTINGTVTGGTLAVGNIINGGTVTFGTAITAVNSATFVSTISTTTITVSSVSAGTITVGMALSGGSVTAGTYIVAFVSGINGGAGTYTLNQSATGTPTTGRSYTVSASQLVKTTTIATGGNINLVGNAKLLGQNSLRFADLDSSNYVAFKAPATVAADVTWTLPSADGTTGQVLTTNGIGTLSWSTVSGGGTGLSSRGVVTAVTSSLTNGSTGNISITGAKGYVLYKIQTTAASWIRIYTDAASRSADSTRLEGTDPLPGSGVIAEIITTGADTILMSPGVIGFNTEAVVSNTIACAVTNKSGATVAITVSLTILTIEV
jgi:hypothetical protein